MTVTWAHDALAADLAGHLRSDSVMTWENLQLGPSGSPRPDVYTIAKSYVSPSPRAYEVKVNRPDFLSDVTSGKWKAYLTYAESVTFALPAGLATKEEVPPTCGLLVRGETGWRTLRRPTPGIVTIPRNAWLKLLIDGVEREGPTYRRRFYNNSVCGKAFAKKFGEDAALWVSNRDAAENAVENAKYTAERVEERAKQEAERLRKTAEEQAPELWRNLCEALGLPVGTSHYTVRDAVTTLRKGAKKDGPPWWMNRLRNSLETAMQEVDVAIREATAPVEVAVEREE